MIPLSKDLPMITPQEALQRTIEHREIFHDEMLKIVRMIMSGELSPVMMAALITGLRVKKETIGEIAGAASDYPGYLDWDELVADAAPVAPVPVAATDPDRRVGRRPR